MYRPQYTHDGYDDTQVMDRRDRGFRAEERRRRRSERGTGVRLAAAIITIVTGFFAVVLGLDIAFELLQANPYNALVVFVDDLAAGLALFFHDLFTPDYDWLRVLLNNGLAALFWLGIGQAIVMLVRSFR